MTKTPDRWEHSQGTYFRDVSGIGRYSARRWYKGARVFELRLNKTGGDRVQATGYAGTLDELAAVVERIIQSGKES